MAKKPAGNLKAYNAAIKAIRASTGVSQKEAQQTYRAAKVRLGRAPTAKDAGSRAVKQEAANAGKQLAAAKRAHDRRIEQAIARAKAPRPKRGVAEPRPGPSRPRGGAAGRGGGGSGGGAGGRGRDYEPDYDFGGFDDEIPDDMYGDDDDSPGRG